MNIPISSLNVKIFYVSTKSSNGRILAGPYSKVGPAKAYITRKQKYRYSKLDEYVIYEVTEVKEYDPNNP
jgi:hypothetical protein